MVAAANNPLALHGPSPARWGLILEDENRRGLPHVVKENIWHEKFGIDYDQLPSSQPAAHAAKM
ncbi:hypothetical protein RvY_00289 [Ramazzottius varieornatus]|uniref:Uncharacterized protein n=1 Tax=Ramazzottius varieornatus TaxID=947166 RepID=A0A1D1UM76_RAMVA|nr:hypothetical protein RvY_00289 [Ramazzottius varieornatus]